MSKQATIEVTIPEALNMDGLELRGNYRIIGYRQDVLHALERKHVAAFIVTALLRWTKSKRDDLVKIIKRRAENKLPPLTEEELEIWIHMSYEEFADEFDGLFSHNTIKDAVAYLIQRGIIQQRKNPNPKFKDYEYRIMLPALRELLRSLPVNPALRPRDNRNRKGNHPPNLVTSPNLVDESPNLVDESPNLANQYTMSTQRQTKSDRKNDPSQQNAPVSTGQDLSFAHSSSKNFSSSQETKPQITLTEDQQRILDFGKKDLFRARTPEVTEKIKSECAELATHIKTQERFDSLVASVRKRFPDGAIHLKNLVNGLNDWLQTQEQEKKPLKVKDLAMRSFKDLAAQQKEMQRQYYERQAAKGRKKAEINGISGENITDSDIVAMIETWSQLYKDAEHAKEHQERIKQVQRESGLDNSTFFGLLYNAKDDTDYSGDSNMNRLFLMLDKQLGRKRALA